MLTRLTFASALATACLTLGAAAPVAARAQAAPATSPAPAPAASASGPAHTHLHAQIRQAHLQRLQDRISTSAEQLHQTCRFESDIATPPPAGLVALSFDDGPDPAHTPQILAVLARYGIPGSFFFIGEKMQRHPDLVRQVQAGGRHAVASHSWSHPDFHEIDEPRQQAEILEGLAQMPGASAPEAPALRLFRYPFGNASCFGNQLLHEQGYRIVGWHVDSCDWAFDHDGHVALHEAVSCGVAPANRSNFVAHVALAARERRGGIVLMHEIHPNTLAQLPQVIEALQREGFTFTRVDDPRLAASLR